MEAWWLARTPQIPIARGIATKPEHTRFMGAQAALQRELFNALALPLALPAAETQPSSAIRALPKKASRGLNPPTTSNSIYG
jgi:hypothetical protein